MYEYKCTIDRVVDGDIVEASNLHRQILYTESDIGTKKAETAAKKLKEINSQIKINFISEFLNKDNDFIFIDKNHVLLSKQPVDY